MDAKKDGVIVYHGHVYIFLTQVNTGIKTGCKFLWYSQGSSVQFIFKEINQSSFPWENDFDSETYTISNYTEDNKRQKIHDLNKTTASCSSAKFSINPGCPPAPIPVTTRKTCHILSIVNPNLNLFCHWHPGGTTQAIHEWFIAFSFSSKSTHPTIVLSHL